MSVLTSLQLTQSQPLKSGNAIEQRRNKLIEKINEQIEIVTAKIDGQVYMPTVTRTRVNAETGQRETFQKQKRVREWFWPNTDGKLHLQIRYGSRVIELAKGKNAIVADDFNQLQAVLNTVKSAVIAGELDTAITAVSSKVKAGFKK